jgi:fermentation-respiration switch protein FrsA (DUF1100 family)
VGVKTVELTLGGGTTPVEIFYPAQPGSQNRSPKVYYNFDDWLPPESGVPRNASSPGFECNAYRDLPIDADHGAYPLIVVIHDTGSFRVASAAQLAHWASRGFIAVAADHPGLTLRDTVAGSGGCTHSGIDEDNAHTRDVPALLGALRDARGSYAFLERARDAQRIALVGHGQAGSAHLVQASGEAGVQLLLSWNANRNLPRHDGLKAFLMLSGQADKLVPYDSVGKAFDATVKDLHPGVLAGLARAGHLTPTELCGARSSDGKDLVAIATQYNACGGAVAQGLNQKLWDCSGSTLAKNETYLDQAEGRQLVNALTTAALEQHLKGLDRSAQWNALKQRANVAELRKQD